MSMCFTSRAVSQTDELELWAGGVTRKGTTWKGRDMTKRCLRCRKKRKRLEMKVGLGAVPRSGRGGNIMIEKWYHPLLRVGGVHANTLCFNEGIFQCVNSSMQELSPACHSVCRTEAKRHCARLKSCSAESKQVHTNMTDDGIFLHSS